MPMFMPDQQEQKNSKKLNPNDIGILLDKGLVNKKTV